MDFAAALAFAFADRPFALGFGDWPTGASLATFGFLVTLVALAAANACSSAGLMVSIFCGVLDGLSERLRLLLALIRVARFEDRVLELKSLDRFLVMLVLSCLALLLPFLRPLCLAALPPFPLPFPFPFPVPFLASFSSLIAALILNCWRRVMGDGLALSCRSQPGQGAGA